MVFSIQSITNFWMLNNSFQQSSVTIAKSARISTSTALMPQASSKVFEAMQRKLRSRSMYRFKVQVTQIFAPPFNSYLERLGQKTYAGKIFLICEPVLWL